MAGSRCVKGTLKKNALYRVVRGQDNIHKGQSLVENDKRNYSAFLNLYEPLSKLIY